MSVWGRPVLASDVEHVAANVRDVDRLECETLFDCDVLDGLSDSVAKASWAAAIIDGDDLIALVGVNPHNGILLSMEGRPWMIGTVGLERHLRAFAAITQPIIARMEREYPLLWNVVHNANVVSIRWLRRSGFNMGKPEPIGRQGTMFRRFYRVRAGCFSQQSLQS